MSYTSEIQNNVLVFRFANGKLNTITDQTLRGLEEAVDRVNQEEELKGLILTGEGKFFSAGFDLNIFTSFSCEEEVIKWIKNVEEVFNKVFTCSKPVVAAINGHCTAAGMMLVMASDYRIVKNHPAIKIGMTEINIGLSLTPTQAEIMRFGLGSDKNYRDVMFTGDLIQPSLAVDKGILDELVADDVQLMARSMEKVLRMIDTPGRPFISLKMLEKKHAARCIREEINTCHWNLFAAVFRDKQVMETINNVKKALGV